MEPLTTCLVLPHARLDGPSNMARDEAMLDHVAGNPGAALFRTYEWAEPTLSLGYFQSYDEVERDPRWRGVAVVRRPSGGGAILHDRELTFAVAIPAGHPLARQGRTLYRAVHDAVTRCLHSAGVEASRRGEDPATADRAHARPFLCFADRDADDLVVGSSKVVGSAQRRRAGAVLQHGALLLLRSTHTPELPGAIDLATRSPGDVDWAGSLRRTVPVELGLSPEEVDWPDELLARADVLVRSVYARDRWTRGRRRGPDRDGTGGSLDCDP